MKSLHEMWYSIQNQESKGKIQNRSAAELTQTSTKGTPIVHLINIDNIRQVLS